MGLRPRSTLHPAIPQPGVGLWRGSRAATARSPNLNAYAERFVRSIKSECQGRVIPLGERHLRTLVAE